MTWVCERIRPAGLWQLAAPFKEETRGAVTEAPPPPPQLPPLLVADLLTRLQHRCFYTKKGRGKTSALMRSTPRAFALHP
jgi:hypothetical protein